MMHSEVGRALCDRLGSMHRFCLKYIKSNKQVNTVISLRTGGSDRFIVYKIIKFDFDRRCSWLSRWVGSRSTEMGCATVPQLRQLSYSLWPSLFFFALHLDGSRSASVPSNNSYLLLVRWPNACEHSSCLFILAKHQTRAHKK